MPRLSVKLLDESLPTSALVILALVYVGYRLGYLKRLNCCSKQKAP